MLSILFLNDTSFYIGIRESKALSMQKHEAVPLYNILFTLPTRNTYCTNSTFETRHYIFLRKAV